MKSRAIFVAAMIPAAATNAQPAANASFDGVGGYSTDDPVAYYGTSGTSVHPYHTVTGSAWAEAQSGLLRSFADLSSVPTNPPPAGFPNIDSQVDTNANVGREFQLTANALPNPGVVDLTFAVTLTGEMSGSVSGPAEFGVVSLYYGLAIDFFSPTAATGDSVYDDAFLTIDANNTSDSLTINNTYLLNISLDLSTPQTLSTFQSLDSQIFADNIDYDATWDATIDLGSSLSWGGLVSATDASGGDVRQYLSAVDASGFDWTQPVPAPGSAAVLALACLGANRRRRDSSRPAAPPA